jgi:hypothetical protein
VILSSPLLHGYSLKAAANSNMVGCLGKKMLQTASLALASAISGWISLADIALLRTTLITQYS